MTVIVTGGAGFIGSALVRQLNAAGESVVTVDKLTYAGNLDNLADLKHPELHRFERIDICDRVAIRALYAQVKPKAVYHLAAESHVDRSIDSPAPFIDTNVSGSLVLLEAAVEHWRGLDDAGKAAFRHLQVSTDEVYGDAEPDEFFTEASPYKPNSPYAASKASSDHLARAFGRTYGLPILVTNCGNNYGPYQFPEKLIPLMILNALEGRALPVYGKGDQIRDWIHVDDHAAALRQVMAKGRVGETYLIGARGTRRNLEIVQTICALLDDFAPQPTGRKYIEYVRYVTDRPGHDTRYAIDPAKCETELGWKPAYDVTSGLRQTVKWYLENRAWCDRAGKQYDRDRIGLAAAKG